MNIFSNVSSENGCVVIFCTVLLEQAGVPFPAAPCLLAAGTACAAGECSLAMVIGATVLASLISDLAWFYAGRHWGERVIHLLCRLGLNGSRSGDQVRRNFARHGMPAVVLAKFVPGLGVLAPPLAGALNISVGRFLVFDTLGSVAYGAFYLLLGVVFSEQVQALLKMFDKLGLCPVVILATLLTVWVVLKHSPRRNPA